MHFRCTATPSPPLIPIFIVVATLDMSSALLFVLGAFKYGRRFSELARSIMGLVFFMVVHTYAREVRFITVPLKFIPKLMYTKEYHP